MKFSGFKVQGVSGMKKSSRLIRALPGFILLAMSVVSGAAHAEIRTTPDKVELAGTFSQGGLIIGKCPVRCDVTFNGKPLKITATGNFVFGFGRDAVAQQKITVTLAKQPPKPFGFTIKQRKYMVHGVPEATVNPPPAVMARIAREQALVDAARAINSDRQDFMSGFSWPLKGRISGVYGSQRIYNGQPGNPHYGLDIAGPVGANVTAPMSGKVRLAEPDLYFSGGTIILDHGHGIFSSYIHLSKVLVKVGQEIKRGDLMAKVGATGRASGPHLDWRINWFNDRLDPQYVVPPQ
jgi:biotin carboxyl carrier protein